MIELSTYALFCLHMYSMRIKRARNVTSLRSFLKQRFVPSKVNIHNLRGEVSLVEQDTIEYAS